jgi:hypothetical protein
MAAVFIGRNDNFSHDAAVIARAHLALTGATTNYEIFINSSLTSGMPPSLCS